MKSEKSYFFLSFIALLLAIVAFFVFQEVLPDKLFPTYKIASPNIVVDSLLLEAMEGSDKIELKNGEEIVYRSTNIKIIDSSGAVISSEEQNPASAEHAVLFTDSENYLGYQYLATFFKSLYELQQDETKKVRIAYYSDSMTDGDMIVQDLRKLFQDKYGGEGVGFVPITSESASSRASITHQFSGNWESQSYLKTKKPSYPFGLAGGIYMANDTLRDTWVSIKAGRMRHVTSLPKPTLFYGNSKNDKGKILRVVGKDTIDYRLMPVLKLNSIRFSNSELDDLKLVLNKANNVPIYGLNFDNEKGVHVDNYSSRGNSGLPLSTFSVALMNEFQKELDYKLIILHYGTNVLNYGSYNYDWYKNKMTKVVAHVKACFPGANVLIISTADKSTKYAQEMQTDSAVVPLMKAQRQSAIQSHSGFINLYQAMGGEGSMVQWVEGEPSRANKDYTHFNYKGSVDIAQLIYDQLNEGFEEYKKGK